MGYAVSIALRQRMAKQFPGEYVALRLDASVVAHDTDEHRLMETLERETDGEEILILGPSE